MIHVEYYDTKKHRWRHRIFFRFSRAWKVFQDNQGYGGAELW